MDGERRFGGKGDLTSDPGDTLDLGDRVGGLIPSDTVLAGLFSVTKVCIDSSPCQLSPSRNETLRQTPLIDLQIPPISSLTTIMSVPLAISGFRGEWAKRPSLIKLAGRMLAYSPSSFRSFKRPCSGRTGPTPHLGPPTAPATECGVQGLASGENAGPTGRLTEQYGVGTLACIQSRVGERNSVVIDTSASKVMRLDVELEVGLGRDGLQHSDGLAGDLRTWSCNRNFSELMRDNGVFSSRAYRYRRQAGRQS